jgi:hypothetical protein
MRIRTLAVTAVLVATSLAGAACGGGDAQPVGRPVAPARPTPTTGPGASAGTTTTTTQTAGGSPAGGASPGGTTSTTPVSTGPVISAQSLATLNAELGSLGTSLNQVDNDLAQAQGDQ